ncbi:uncharacterized protein LOC101898938 [Musca domestica]|uniref:Uncharacterized protein LOC101898938 n=1 Tax=Musca domestica TaxID=7370 RepID=A0A1I8MWH8_MUSDO|nr:uncharacterized protein LOC101898938 [Musca domestica]
MFGKSMALLVFLSVLSYKCVAPASNDCKERIRKTCRREVQNLCYLDTERGCFRHFQSNCDMEISACKNEMVYEAWPEKYCSSLQFMCQEEIEEYNWPPDNFYQQIEHIRDNATNLFEEMLAG